LAAAAPPRSARTHRVAAAEEGAEEGAEVEGSQPTHAQEAAGTLLSPLSEG